jgi:outer membrane protein assembly factor BamB/tetratricopeptide (TPR) repeat protein
MSFRGNLKTLALSDIFQTLAMNSQSGVLRLVRKPGWTIRLICFENGEVRNAARGQPRSPRSSKEERPEVKKVGVGKAKAPPKAEELPPLVTYLVGRCLLTLEQAGTLAGQMAGSDAPAAKLIAQLGYAPEDQIAHLVKRFTEEEVYEVFTWDDADFEFTDGAPEPGVFSADAPSVGVRLSTGSLVMEAARRIDEWGRFRQALPSGREILVAAALDATGQLPAQIEGLDPVMHRILAMADGTRDIDDLIADSWLSRYEVGGILCFLLEGGHVRSAGRPEIERAGALLARAQNWSRLTKVYERLLALGQDTPEIRSRLADAAAKAGDTERAAIHLGVLADRAMEQGNEKKAVELWERILGILPRNCRAHQALAEHHLRQGHRDESLNHYTALVKVQIASGAHDRAIAAAQAAVEAGKKDPKPHGLLAEALLAAGRNSEAADQYEELAEGLAGAGEVRAAGDALRHALQIEPGREETRKRLTALLNTEDRRRHAHKRLLVIIPLTALLVGGITALAYREFMVVRPGSKRACDEAAGYRARAEERARAKDFDGAIAWLRKACDAYERSRQAWALLGQSEEVMSRRRDCLAQIDKLQGEKLELEKEVSAKAGQIRKNAEDRLSEGKLEEARDLLRLLERAGREADQEYARRQLRVVEANLAEIREAEKKSGGYASEQEEFDNVLRLSRKYPGNPVIMALTFPVRIETEPAGAEVRLNDGRSSPSPCALRLAVAGPNRIAIGLKGYAEMQLSPTIGEIPAARTVRRDLVRVPAWKVRVDAQVDAPITVVPGKGQVVFGDRAGNLWCLSASDGKQVWKRSLGALAAVNSAVVIEGQTAYASSFDNRVYAVNLADGLDRWTPFKTEGMVRAAPRVAKVQLLNNQTFLFVGAEDGRVYCLDAATGELRWKSARMGAIGASPAVTAEAVYAASDDEHVHALAIADGKELWSHKLGAALRSSPVIIGDMMYLGAEDGGLYALDLTRREVRWRQQARGAVRAGPVMANSQLYFASMEGELWALEPTAARPGVVRQWGLGAAISSAPLVTEKRIYLGSHDGCFRALDRGSEREVWRFKPGEGTMRSAAAMVDGMVIFGSDDGFVYGFDEK